MRNQCGENRGGVSVRPSEGWCFFGALTLLGRDLLPYEIVLQSTLTKVRLGSVEEVGPIVQ